MIHNLNYLAKTLESAQQLNGSFLMTVSSDRHFSNAKNLESNFFNALILSAISNCGMENLEGVKKRLARFISSQIDPKGGVNYWARNSEIAKFRPYPDDLDDIFCSYASLAIYNPVMINGEILAHVVQILTALETEEGGPYRTWLVAKDSKQEWLDVDLVVNSNVLYFLKLQNITLPNLNKYIEKKVMAKEFSSPYYHGTLPVLYFLSRGYSGKSEPLIKELLGNSKGYKGLELQDIALVLTALINLGYKGAIIDQMASFLALQSSKKPILAAPFHIDEVIRGEPQYAGSAALTAAFILEALSKYELQKQASFKVISEDRNLAEVRGLIIQDLNSLGKRFQVSMCEQLKKEYLGITEGRYGDEIMFLPYFTYSMLDPKFKQWKKFEKIIKEACTIGVYGWVAYSIFDDFIDNEGASSRLPLGIVYYREMLKSISEINSPFSEGVLNGIDQANFLELTTCNIALDSKRINLQKLDIPKFKTLEMLANKSIGHALGSLSVYEQWLRHKGVTANRRAKAVDLLKEFFSEYIIARQLSDDLHDWKQDLNMGRVNCVSAWMLENLKRKHKRAISKERLYEDLQDLYWKKALPMFAHKMLDATTHAKKISKRLLHFENLGLLNNLLDPYERVAKKSIDESKRAREFLSTYAK